MHLHSKILNSKYHSRRQQYLNQNKNDTASKTKVRVFHSSSSTRESAAELAKSLTMKQNHPQTASSLISINSPSNLSNSQCSLEFKDQQQQDDPKMINDSSFQNLSSQQLFSSIISSQPAGSFFQPTTQFYKQSMNNQRLNSSQSNKLSTSQISNSTNKVIPNHSFSHLQSNNHQEVKEFFRSIKFNALQKKRGNGEVMPQLQPQASLKHFSYSLVGIQNGQIQNRKPSNSFQIIEEENLDNSSLQQIQQQQQQQKGVSMSYRNLRENNFQQKRTQSSAFQKKHNSSQSSNLMNPVEKKSDGSENIEVVEKTKKQQKLNDRIQKIMNFSLTKELNDLVFQLKGGQKQSILKLPSLTPALSPKGSIYIPSEKEFKLKKGYASLPSVSRSSSSQHQQINNISSKKKQVHFIIEEQGDNQITINDQFLP